MIFEDDPNNRHQNVLGKYHKNSVYEENLVPRIGIFCLNDYWLPLKVTIIVSKSAMIAPLQIVLFIVMFCIRGCTDSITIHCIVH